MTLTLVVLAAGLGSRYGGLKQMDPVGPGGETVLDYAVFDALRSGFDRLVFVIRRDFAEAFAAAVGRRYGERATVVYVYQEMTDLPAGGTPPPGRVKPWGTGHAVWCAREALTTPFAVINADDFYGRDAFRQLGSFLASAPRAGSPAAGCMVGFRLAQTLSAHGTVSRGICCLEPDGRLRTVVEHTALEPSARGARQRQADGTVTEFGGDTLVSMNCWGLTPAVLPSWERELAAFWRERGGDPQAEFYLPTAVTSLIARGELTVQVLPTEGSWFGITYREDKLQVETALRRLIDAGEYPATLWR